MARKQADTQDTPREETPKALASQVYFFPDLLGDGRSIAVEAESREAAEKAARKQLEEEQSR